MSLVESSMRRRLYIEDVRNSMHSIYASRAVQFQSHAELVCPIIILTMDVAPRHRRALGRVLGRVSASFVLCRGKM